MPATKTRQRERLKQVLALKASGLTQVEIAKEFGVSRSSIARDFAELRPSADEVQSRLQRLTSEIHRVITVKQRATKYATLATSAKNEAVSLGALQRIDDLDDIVTEKEKIRAKRDEPQQAQAMFQLPAGASVNVTINQQNNTTYSKDVGLHNTSTETLKNDTPIYKDTDHGD